MERLMRFSLENKLLIVVGVVLIVALGILSLRTLPIDAFPDVTNVQVEIISNAPGLSPLEIEKLVTYRIETAMRGLPGLVTMRSTTKYGLSVLTLVFRDDVDIYFARNLVFERLTFAEKELPDGVKTEMGPIATAMGEVYQFTLEGREPRDSSQKVRYFTELRTLEDWVIAPLLKSVPGVNEVNSFGGYIKEYQVIADPDRLIKYRLSINDLAQALKENNANAGGGFINQASEQFIIRGVGLIAQEQDIKNIVVKEYAGIPTLVRDVADVQLGYAPRQGVALKNGPNETVGGIVMMLKGENGLAVVNKIEEQVKTINSGNVLPPGIKIKPYYLRSEIVGKSVETVTRTLLEGSFLVGVILYLLLGNFRGALAVILSLPLSLLLTFTVMRAVGLSANLMSLGGLAISIGMIIDATIIQVENVQRHLGRMHAGATRLKTVLAAVMEVRKPSIFGEFIIALTFIPILALKGMEGKMFAPLALTVAIALFASLFLSVFVVPVFCSLFLKQGDEKESRLIGVVKKAYLPLTVSGIRHPVVVLGISGLLLAGTALLIPHMGTEFIPVMDEGAFDMDIQLLPGVSLDRSAELAGLVQARLMKFPELETLVSRTGQTGIALEARGVDKTGFTGMLKPRAEWASASTKEDLISQMRSRLTDIPGMAFSFSQPIQCRIDELVAGTRAQIILKLFGPDVEILKTQINAMAKVLSGIPGLTDLVVEKVSGQPYIVIHIDRGQIARYGINVSEVLRVIEIAIGGKSVTQVLEENQAFDLSVRLQEDKRNSLEKIGNLLLRTESGFNVPLNQVAKISMLEGPVQISRENGQRRIGLEMNVVGRDIGSFVGEAQRLIKSNVQLPTGYTINWGGQFENQQEAMRRLMIIMPLVVLLVLLLLFVTFSSIRPALLVFLNLPFALMGGVAALWGTGLYLSVPASLGFIVLFGVAVLNGLVLVSTLLQLRKEGHPVQWAILEACSFRLRPVLMTASITVFSLIPLLFASGPGSEIQKPLAVVVVGGLFTSTLSTLLVLPSMFGWFESSKLKMTNGNNE
jgi:heavy metal efflux system protein